MIGGAERGQLHDVLDASPRRRIDRRDLQAGHVRMVAGQEKHRFDAGKHTLDRGGRRQIRLYPTDAWPCLLRRGTAGHSDSRHAFAGQDRDQFVADGASCAEHKNHDQHCGQMKSKPFHNPTPARVCSIFKARRGTRRRRAKTSHKIPHASSKPSAVAAFVMITGRTGR